MIIYEVGKQFLGPVPPQDGANFEFGPDGNMVLIIQFRNPTEGERAALKDGFKRYSYGEYDDPLKTSLACWVFQFPAPVRYIDAPFHAGLYQDDRGKKFLDDGGNALSLYVLDGDILTVLRYCGLQPAAMDLFRDTVRRQISRRITREQYNSAVDYLYRNTSEDIFIKGHYFAHKELQS